jgi:2-amino-4-hydroxy-6-hydroxymethyldihydropteridine diphosphokinase
MSVVVFLGLGSNLSDPRMQLQKAITALADLRKSRLVAVSSFYRSRPMGPQDQPEYINAVVSLETELEPEALLNALQTIERDQGRVRDRHWGARTLDLDILLYGNEVISTERLTVPHPGLQLREFVLYPLHELAPELEVPGLGPMASLCQNCDANGIKRLEGREASVS